MILDMQSIYTKYINKINKVDKKHDEIRTCTLKLEQKLDICNKKENRQLFFFNNKL